MRLLIAASGTGGHVFPALAVAEQLPEAQVEWLGVRDRMETKLVGDRYPLHIIDVEGFQKPFGLQTLRIAGRFVGAIAKVRRLLRERGISAVLTTGGYIAAPAIVAARWEGIPVVLHESNAIPGKVTRWFGSGCDTVAIGFASSDRRLGRVPTAWVGTPVRSEFRTPQVLDLEIPADRPLIVVMGGSQGAVSVNQLVRASAPAWFEEGAWVVHLTGDRDPEAGSLTHPQYVALPFYDKVAGLLQRADLAISRAGAGTMTELAVAQTPAILIPYPYAAENHQDYNAAEFGEAGAAIVYSQASLTAEILREKVLELLRSPATLAAMKAKMTPLAVADSAERLAALVQQAIQNRSSVG